MSTTIDGVEIINATPHVIRFRASDGTDVEVAPCGALVGAKAEESDYGRRGAASLVTTRFVPSEQGLAELAALEGDHPNAVIVGSIISAQAFPGRVMAMVPAPGFERVAPAEKRMLPTKFTAF